MPYLRQPPSNVREQSNAPDPTFRGVVIPERLRRMSLAELTAAARRIERRLRRLHSTTIEIQDFSNAATDRVDHIANGIESLRTAIPAFNVTSLSLRKGHLHRREEEWSEVRNEHNVQVEALQLQLGMINMLIVSRRQQQRISRNPSNTQGRRRREAQPQPQRPRQGAAEVQSLARITKALARKFKKFGHK